MVRSSRFFVALALAGCAFAASAAPPEAAAAPNELTRVLACRAQTADKDRLACFDGAVGVLSDAVSRNDVTVIDKQELSKARRTLFGFSLPNLKAFGIGESAEAKKNPVFTTLNTHVRSARKVAYGRWDIELDEHAIWRNLDQIDFTPEPGDAVNIEKGAFSYFMKIGVERPIRAERLR